MMRRVVTVALAWLAVSTVAACGDDAPQAAPPLSTSTTVATTTTIAPATSTTHTPVTTAPPTTTEDVAEPALRDELLQMLALDQAVRTGVAPEGVDIDTLDIGRVDLDNQTRLSEIWDQYGWPGWELVGRDGSTAAWAIAQHADFDLEFQQRGLALLREAVAAGDASKGDLAYLTDRVLVATGQPQEYGTQWELGANGELQPRVGIVDEANVDARRAAAGLSTLDEYLEELQSTE